MLMLFGFNGTEIQARAVQGWFTPETLDGLKEFCNKVADAYLEAKAEMDSYSEGYEARKAHNPKGEIDKRM
jgi:hypothetical protein